MTTAQIPPYELWSDCPGTLLNKPEWEAANAAHATGTNFGDVPEGWPKIIEGPYVWDGKDLEAYPEKFIRVLTEAEIEEVDAALKVRLPNLSRTLS